MTLKEAIGLRHSVRNYLPKPLPSDIIDRLNTEIEEINRESGLHIQLIVNEPQAFAGPLARYGKFSNVTNYFVVAGRKSERLDETAGYFGERLVLYAQTLGLNTCWVGLSYRKIDNTYTLADDEKIVCYIAVGYGATQGVAHRTKTPEQVSNITPESPDWFRKGVEAALLAPTAVNQQKFFFKLADDGTLTGKLPRVVAKRQFSLAGYTKVDLGIAKFHFDTASAPTEFTWENSD